MHERENLIDFPCAPIWAEHYAQQGLTPGYPSELYNKPRLPTIEPADKIETEWTRRQWDTVGQLRGQIKYLETKLYEHIDKAKKRKGDYV